MKSFTLRQSGKSSEGLARLETTTTNKQIQNQFDATVLECTFQVVRVFNDVCEKDTCEDKACETAVRFMTIFTIITDDQSYVTARHELEPECKCRYGGRTMTRDCILLGRPCTPLHCLSDAYLGCINPYYKVALQSVVVAITWG